MKVLVINGSPKQHGCTDTALSEVEAQLHREGIETERHWVGRQPVPGCLGCNHCAEAGKCVFHDGVNELADRVDRAAQANRMVQNRRSSTATGKHQESRRTAKTKKKQNIKPKKDRDSTALFLPFAAAEP